MNKLLSSIVALFLFTGGALAQNAGTVTNHAFPIGKGAGVTGYGSLLLGSGQIAIGQTSADPSAITPTGDVTITAAGVTAVGTNKVTNGMLRQSGALALVGRSANSTGNVADITATAGSSCVFLESSSTLTCATIATANIAANAVTNAKMATAGAYTFKCNNSGSTATLADCDATAFTSKPAPVSADIVVIQDSAASNAYKRTTVGALSSAGSVASLNGKTGALSLSIAMRTVTAAGTSTNTPTTGTVYTVFQIKGGGGSGGSAATSSGYASGSGGGEGAFTECTLSFASSNGVTLTVGAGGTASAAAGAGNAGGASSVSTLCTAPGGSGGAAAVANTPSVGGTGGVAGTGPAGSKLQPGNNGFGGTGSGLSTTTFAPAVGGFGNAGMAGRGSAGAASVGSGVAAASAAAEAGSIVALDYIIN